MADRRHRRFHITKVSGAWWLVDRQSWLCSRLDTFAQAVAELDAWIRAGREIPC